MNSYAIFWQTHGAKSHRRRGTRATEAGRGRTPCRYRIPRYRRLHPVSEQPACGQCGCLSSTSFSRSASKKWTGHHGLVNKFDGDTSLANLRVPNHLDHPEDETLATACAIADRLTTETPECQASTDVVMSQVVVGNVATKKQFEYIVIGKPANETTQLCELAKSYPGRVLATTTTLQDVSENDCTRLFLGEIMRALRAQASHPTGVVRVSCQAWMTFDDYKFSSKHMTQPGS